MDNDQLLGGTQRCSRHTPVCGPLEYIIGWETVRCQRWQGREDEVLGRSVSRELDRFVPEPVGTSAAR